MFVVFTINFLSIYAGAVNYLNGFCFTGLHLDFTCLVDSGLWALRGRGMREHPLKTK